MTHATAKPLFSMAAIEADDAFDFAIDTGRLSTDKTAANYAGNYMYMGRGENGAQFKNIVTREYL